MIHVYELDFSGMKVVFRGLYIGCGPHKDELQICFARLARIEKCYTLNTESYHSLGFKLNRIIVV